MKKIFIHLGTDSPDYRGLMHAQQDLELPGQTVPAANLVICEQTHSSLVHICREGDSGAGLGAHPQIPVADGFSTNIPGQFLLIRTADCYPVLFSDAEAMVVAAVHSGREGTRQNIVEQAVNAMMRNYGCDPANIVAHIGAGICEDHYEVSEEIWREFNQTLEQQGFCPCTKKFRHLNIRTTIFQQLIRAGLKFINIENIHACTFENPNYFSYRRDKGNNRQINIIGIINE
jgi:YfiH family protein